MINSSTFDSSYMGETENIEGQLKLPYSGILMVDILYNQMVGK
jgi:hypothetical protein